MRKERKSRKIRDLDVDWDSWELGVLRRCGFRSGRSVDAVPGYHTRHPNHTGSLNGGTCFVRYSVFPIRTDRLM